jgi:integrase
LTSWLTARLLGNSNQKAVKPDTALADLAALQAYHIDNFLEDKLFDNKHFWRLIDGARRLNPITKVRVRKPISRDTITKLSAGLATLPLQPLEMTTNLLDDLNFATACRVAFAGFLRPGEFTYKTEDLSARPIFSATKLTRSDVRFSSSLDHVQLTLKRSKTDRCHEGVQIILVKTGDGACPVDALQKLLLLDPRGPDAPLFAFHRKPSSRSNFLSTLSTRLRALSIRTDGYSGHSFRKGAAQHAHDSGILDEQIQVLGR